MVSAMVKLRHLSGRYSRGCFRNLRSVGSLSVAGTPHARNHWGSWPAPFERLCFNARFELASEIAERKHLGCRSFLLQRPTRKPKILLSYQCQRALRLTNTYRLLRLAQCRHFILKRIN
jgi:hypothetical protein